MENKFFISLVGTFLLLACPNQGSPESSAFFSTQIILQTIDSGDLNEEQEEILRLELDAYQQSLEPLRKTDIKAWVQSIQDMFKKLGEGFRIYRLSKSNPDLKLRAEEFTAQTNIRVYILSYVEDAWLNNLFSRLAELAYDQVDQTHVKMRYKFKKSTTDTSSKFSVQLDLIYDSSLVELLKGKLLKDYSEFSDQALEAHANKDLTAAGFQDIYSDAASNNTGLQPTAEEILSKLASANVVAVDAVEEDYLLVNICDSLVKTDGIYYWNKDCSLKVMLKNKDTVGVKEISLGLTINITNSKNDQSFPFVIKDFNEWKTLKLDSLPEGKYSFKASINKKPRGKTFYLRKKKLAYACTKCGRDLEVTLDRLRKIFPKNELTNSQDALLFNKALKISGFNSCKKQIHFFSQVRLESSNYTAFRENGNYTLEGFVGTFKNNCNLQGVFNQSFLDSKIYKNYFCYRSYEVDSTSKKTKYVGKSVQTFYWIPKCASGIKVKKESDTLRIPTIYQLTSTGTKGKYVSINYSDSQKNQIRERLFSLTYAHMLGNGDSSTHDGNNFRGKGALQLTGRANFAGASKTANKLFNANYDWEKNFNDIAEKQDVIIYSAVAFFVFRLKDFALLEKGNVTEVTKLVNGGDNGLSERKKFYNELLKSELYDCAIPKE